MTAAIEAAARAKLSWNWPSLSDANLDEMWPDHVDETRAVIIAFLRNTKPPLDDIIYETADVTLPELEAMFDRMATELEGK